MEKASPKSARRQRNLALHTAGGQAADEMLFDEHEQDDHRDGRQQRGGKQVLPLDHVEGTELRNAYGDGLVGGGGDEHGGDGVLVPRVDEYENQRGYDAGRRHGQKDADEGADAVAPVDAGGLFHFRGNRNEGAPQQPDGERLIERRVDEHQPQDGIVQAQRVHQLCDAHQQHHRREHLTHDDKAQEGLFAPELHARHGVGGGDAAHQGDGRRARGQQDGIKQEAGHASGDDVADVAPYPGGRQDVQEVHVGGFGVAAEGGDQHDKERIENHHAQHDHERI